MLVQIHLKEQIFRVSLFWELNHVFVYVCVCGGGGDFSRLSFESVKRNGFFVMFIYSKLIYYRKLDRLLIFIADDKDQNLNLGDNGNLALGY